LYFKLHFEREIVCEKKIKNNDKRGEDFAKVFEKMIGKDLPFHVGAFHLEE
jgi:hypothetical protein